MPFGAYDHRPNDPKTKGEKDSIHKTSNTLLNAKQQHRLQESLFGPKNKRRKDSIHKTSNTMLLNAK
jgi:hypothetical protein